MKINLHKIIFILLCAVSVSLASCGLPQKLAQKLKQQKAASEQNKDLPYKITISGTKGLKFDGYYSTGVGRYGETLDSMHLQGVIPAEFYVKSSSSIFCAASKEGKGTIRVTISGNQIGDIVADSSNSERGMVYVGTTMDGHYRRIGPGIEHSPAAYFLKVESKGTLPHDVIIYKDWDDGVHLSNSVTEKCPFTIRLPDCDEIEARFITTTDMNEFYITLTDANNKILKKDSSIVNLGTFKFQYRSEDNR